MEIILTYYMSDNIFLGSVIDYVFNSVEMIDVLIHWIFIINIR